MRRAALDGILEARSFRARLVGLMGKRTWPRDHRGILFPECPSLHTFFTFLRPDIVFMDKNKKILKIIPSAAPWRFFIGPKGTAHALETPAGTARKGRWTAGSTVLKIRSNPVQGAPP